MDSMFCNCPAWNTVDQTKFSNANECHVDPE